MMTKQSSTFEVKIECSPAANILATPMSDLLYILRYYGNKSKKAVSLY